MATGIISRVKYDDSPDFRILSRRVAGSGEGNSVENWGSSPEGVTPQNPAQKAPPPRVSGATGMSDSAKPIRYLSRRDGNTSPASVSETGAPAAQLVLPGQLNSSGGPTDWAAALAGLGPLNPMRAAGPPPQAGGKPRT